MLNAYIGKKMVWTL